MSKYDGVCCTCHCGHPPCGFCENMTEEEADAYSAGGSEAVIALRDRIEDGVNMENVNVVMTSGDVRAWFDRRIAEARPTLPPNLKFNIVVVKPPDTVLDAIEHWGRAACNLREPSQANYKKDYLSYDSKPMQDVIPVSLWISKDAFAE